MAEIYVVVYDSKNQIEMTKDELQGFLLQLQSTEVVEFNGNFLTKFFRVILKKQLTEGRLNDGTKVFRMNGQWKDAGDPTLHLDPHYYPEIMSDTVKSEEEYQQRLKGIPQPPEFKSLPEIE